MEYNCEVKEQPAQHTLSIRTRTAVENLPQAIGKAFGDVAQYVMGELGEQFAGPPFTAYYNMDMQDLDVEMGFAVLKKLSGKGDIQSSEIPAGKMATLLYTGPYSDMEPAYNALFQWIQDNGYEATGVAYEVYLNDPSEVPPEKLQTQIMFPFK